MRHDRMFTAVVLACLLWAGAGFAEQGDKRTCDVPLVVTAYVPQSRYPEMVTGLGVNDLKVQLGTEWLPVASLSVDDGPKRMAVIIDDSARVLQDEWKMEQELAATFIGHGRRGDTFALLRVGAPGAPTRFAPAKETQKRLRNLKFPRRASARPDGAVYDALTAASNLLSPPRFGDALFFLAAPTIPARPGSIKFGNCC